MTDADLQKLFLSKFAPFRDVVAPTLGIGTNPHANTYFEEILEPNAMVSHNDIVSSMLEIWKHQKLPALVTLEPEIRRMMRELTLPDTVDPELSGFIYAMY